VGIVLTLPLGRSRFLLKLGVGGILLAGLVLLIWLLTRGRDNEKEPGPPGDGQTESVDNFVLELGGGVKLELVLIKAKGKSFRMGSPNSDPNRSSPEQPQHEVAFTRDWYIGKFEVTVGQFKAFVADNPGYRTEAEKTGEGKTWRDPDFKQGDDHPVVCVCWNDAQDFCKWLSKKPGGRKFRLPFEAEWEYSCRAGTTTRYYFGDDAKDLTDYAWFVGNTNNQTHPVG